MTPQGPELKDLNNDSPSQQALKAAHAAAEKAAAEHPHIPARPVNEEDADHPMRRLERVEHVLNGMLEKMGASIQSPISPEDAENLRRYLRGNE